MVIDLNRCTGCSGCVTACYAENNVPVVGPEMVAMGREMSWLRVERYYEEHPAEPVQFLPMLCQHCDAAPCEPVCPVFAAYHTDEGLNGQVYNRCIGTRYCANNCPWKVRRFNWFEPDWPEPLNWQLNPDVTARSRGVMEKCTFCVQRIRGGERQAKIDQRPLRDGDIVPACAQACASRAIVFGDLMDPNSEVSRLIESNRRYQVLGELNTRPAVIYLKRVVRDGEA
ncbi:MAG: 4Fe-4S dicluster domain-containing protein [Armatimonadetes bacterium]|nr:4Fe-4S dicluster domain-containing protein [Armatimonadota bacterium]